MIKMLVVTMNDVDCDNSVDCDISDDKDEDDDDLEKAVNGHQL